MLRGFMPGFVALGPVILMSVDERGFCLRRHGRRERPADPEGIETRLFAGRGVAIDPVERSEEQLGLRVERAFDPGRPRPKLTGVEARRLDRPDERLDVDAARIVLVREARGSDLNGIARLSPRYHPYLLSTPGFKADFPKP